MMRLPRGIACAGEAVGVARAVEALVLVAHDPRDAAQAGDRAQDALADDRVLAHSSHSSPRSGPGLCRMRSGIADLADVVQQRGVADALDLDLVQAEPVGDGPGHVDDHRGVLARVAVALDECGGQRLDDVRLGAEGVHAAAGRAGRGAGAAVGAGAIQPAGGGGQQALDRGARAMGGHPGRDGDEAGVRDVVALELGDQALAADARATRPSCRA